MTWELGPQSADDPRPHYYQERVLKCDKCGNDGFFLAVSPMDGLVWAQCCRCLQLAETMLDEVCGKGSYRVS